MKVINRVMGGWWVGGGGGGDIQYSPDGWDVARYTRSEVPVYCSLESGKQVARYED